MLKFSAIRKAAVRICGGQTVTAATAMRYLVTLSNTDTSGISILQLKDGPLNKLSPDMMRDIVGSVKEAEARSNCRGLIITSTGRLFSVGLDMTYLVRIVLECSIIRRH